MTEIKSNNSKRQDMSREMLLISENLNIIEKNFADF